MKINIKEGLEIYLDGNLKSALDSMVYNIKADWDFVIVISGDRMVRVGKSVLAQNIAAYLSFRLKTSFNLDNIFFDSQSMIDAAQSMPKNSILIYDEGREGLAASKNGKQLQNDLLDYFAECGQMNHIFIVVLPDFFELKENIAVGRSECLINVYRKTENSMMDIYNEGEKLPIVKLERGYFEFFARKTKEKLYDIARSKHMKNYSVVKANFIGRFTNTYCVDEIAYREKKRQALQRFKEKKEQEHKSKSDTIRNKIILECKQKGMSCESIRQELEEKYDYVISKRTIERVIESKKDTECAI